MDGDGASGPFTRSSAFMRLRQQRPGRLPHDAYLKGRRWPAGGDRSRASLLPAAVEGWLVQFAVGLQMAEAFWTVERYDDGSYTLWTYSGDGQSWASADYEPGAESFEVVQSGPRRLWDATEAAHAWWDARGRPDVERFGLTVSREGQRAWLDTPDNPVPIVR
ncbi:hypothetical protein [Streptomyces anulatus]|uniref:Protein-L-isoaspartate O-methyltransferase n=1 Tax=Streptomyces anulatus TaxID=1892 RepID=A0ABZ1ZEZ4_STRAQ|nr:hypothetical protein [Streptomyces anulatus]